MSGTFKFESIRDVNDLEKIPFKAIQPFGWNNACSVWVRNAFTNGYGKGVNVPLDFVKSGMVHELENFIAEIPASERPLLLNASGRLDRTFDAIHFHAIIYETLDSDPMKIKNGRFILDMFKTENVKLDSTLKCSHGVADKEINSKAKPHYILELKEPTDKKKYRCVSCGETSYIVKVHNMTDGYKYAHGRSEEEAEKARDTLIGRLRFFNSETNEATRNVMYDAGVSYLNEAEPPGISGGAVTK